tara:strand:- start:3248 stop:3508 length:261 start_codon:yes stop_codon:yes gene_type:complete
MEVEYRIINSAEMPPIIISQTENDKPKIVVNSYHKIWISLYRKTIAGIVHSLQDKMDDLLTSFLVEQRQFEKDDQDFMNDSTGDLE